MKVRNVLKLAVLALAVAAWTFSIPSASAGVVGHLSVGICGGGGVTVSAALIDWAPGSPSACLQVGILTNITSVGDGNLTPASATGLINDLPSLLPGAGTIGFMKFGALSFDLASVGGFGPGSGVSCASDPGVNNSCSIPTSPFLLTQTSTGSSVTLLAHGTIFDSGDGITSFWNGSFTTQINGPDPASIQATILGGGSITSSFSGEFDVTPTPEPVSMALIGGGLIAFAVIKKRKRV